MEQVTSEQTSYRAPLLPAARVWRYVNYYRQKVSWRKYASDLPTRIVISWHDTIISWHDTIISWHDIIISCCVWFEATG